MTAKKYWLYFCILLAATTAVRVIMAALLGIGVDEAHYVQYALHPALSYYDHPPLVGGAIRIAMDCFGRSELAVRLPALFAGIGTMLLLWRLGVMAAGPAAGFWSAVIFNSVFLFSAGAFMIVPDTLLAFLWTAAVWCAAEIARTGRRFLWYPVGLLAGAAFLAKYTGLLLWPSLALFCLLVPGMRCWFRRKEPYLALLIGGLLSLPVILWNYDHDWISFGFQIRHGFSERAFFSPSVFLLNLGAVAFVFSLLLFFFLLWCLYRALRASLRGDRFASLAVSFSLPCLLLFGVASLGNKILPHWPAVGFLPLIFIGGRELAVLFAESGGALRDRFMRGFAVAALVVGGIFSALAPVQSFFRILPLPSGVDPTNDLAGWRETAAEVVRLNRREPDAHFLIITNRFYPAGQMAFYLPAEMQPVYCFGLQTDQYDFWQEGNLRKKLSGRNAIFFCDDHFAVDPTQLYRFRRIVPEGPFTVSKRGRTVRTVFLYRCYGFETEKTPPDIFYSPSLRPRDYRVAASLLNDRLFRFFNGLAGRHVPIDLLFMAFGLPGNGWFIIPVVGVLLWMSRRRDFLFLFAAFLLILLVGGVTVNLLKEYFHVQRPLLHFPAGTVTVLGPRLKAGSFPSGHAQTVFSAVFFLLYIIPRFWYLFLAAGLLTAVSRCYVGAHFPLDVVAGIAIAAFFTVVVMDLLPVIMKRWKGDGGEKQS